MAWRSAPLLGAAAAWPSLAAAIALALAVGGLKGRYVLARTARRNRARIGRLARPRPWNAFTPRFYVLIAAMVGLGILLRRGAERGVFEPVWVGALYLGIGCALLVSAAVYFLPPRAPLDLDLASEPAPRARPVGVLLVNLGTPEAPTARAVRRYLREFLGDPRVVEANRLAWALVLNAIVLPRRAGASAQAYRKVWTPEGSPLLVHARALAERLSRLLGPDYRVAIGMRYGRPALGAGLEELWGAGCEEVVVVPLFPQYSNTTSGSIQAEAARCVTARRHQPALRFVGPYYDDPGYLDAVEERIRATVREAGGAAALDHHVFSFHGLPEEYVRRGDPYPEHCRRTAWALARRLGLAADGWSIAFQSRFGDEPWLRPYLDELLADLAETRKRVLVALPGFAADCLETLEEVRLRAREGFRSAGGESLWVVPALNDSETFARALARIVADSGVSLERSSPASTMRPVRGPLR